MAVAGLLSVGLVLGFAIYRSSAQAAAGREMARVSDGMSDQWNADMMHDGLRADVMSAMYATNDAQRAAYGVADVNDHAKTIVEMFDAAAAEAPADLRPQYATV